MNKSHRVKSSIKAIKIDIEVVLLVGLFAVLLIFYMNLNDFNSSKDKDKFPVFGQPEDEVVVEK